MIAGIAGTATTTDTIRVTTGSSGQEPQEITTNHPEGMLNGPCHMHYTYIDGKRVSNHAMKDCRTFIKLQEAVGSKQAKARS
jgi:hypothetical protein